MPLPKKREPPKKDPPKKGKNLLDEATKEMNAGKYGRAAAMLKELVAAEPKNQQARRLFATLHLKTGNLITAKSAFDSLIRSALEAQDYWLAESLLREYLTAGPRYVPFLMKLGEVLEAKGDAGAAATEYGRAIEILTEDPDADQPELPKQLFERVERIAPTSPVVARWAATFAPPPPSPPPAPAAQAAAKAPPPASATAAPPVSKAARPSATALPGKGASPSPPPESPPPSRSDAPAAPPVPGGPSATAMTPGSAAVMQGQPSSPSSETSGEKPSTPVSSHEAPTPPPPQAPPSPVTASAPAATPRKVLSLEELLAEVTGTAEEHSTGPTPSVPSEPVSTAVAEPMTAAPSAPAVEPASGDHDGAVPPPAVSAEPAAPAAPESVTAAMPPPDVDLPESATTQERMDPVAATEESVASVPSPPEAPSQSSGEQPPQPTFGFSVAESTEEAEASATSPIAPSGALSELSSSTESAPSPPTDTAQPVASESGFRFANLSEPGPVQAESPETHAEQGTPESQSAFQMSPSESPEIDEAGWAPPPVAAYEPEPPVAQGEPEPAPASAAQWEPPAEAAPSPASSVEQTPSDAVFGSSSTPEEAAAYVPWTPTEEDAVAPSESETVGTKNFFDQETFSIAALDGGSPETTYAREPVYETARPLPAKKRKPLKPKVSLKLAVRIKSWLASAGAATKTAVVVSVLITVLSIISLGGITLAWLGLEQQPTGVYLELTRVPTRTIQDPSQNGYLMLMGFTEAATGDPIRAGLAAVETPDPGRTHWCFGDQGSSGPLRFPPEASALSGMYLADDPVAQFINQQGVIRSWSSAGAPLITRYRQWLPMSFDDWGYGILNSPDCEQILTAHRLYVAEGFLADLGTGFNRLEKELAVWRAVMAAARTLSVKVLAVTVINEDLMVLAGMLNRPDFESQLLPRVTNVTRSLDSLERSMKWPIQNEAAVSPKLTEKKMAPEALEQATSVARFITHLPMPRQRMLNAHADYFDALVRVGEAPSNRLPQLYNFAHTPAKSPMDYVVNPIENVFGALWTPEIGDLTGRVIETEARLRLVGLLERIRRPSFDPNVLSRIAKAGQGFYDPFTDIPMLVSTDRRRLYSVGRDRQDGNGDPVTDVSVLLPTKLP